MKIYHLLLLICIAILLTSCMGESSHPVKEDFLCSINSDGTGFRKLIRMGELPVINSLIQDLYVTKDGKLIFAADKYYICDPDSLYPMPFTDLLSPESRRLSLSNDNKAYYCSNGDLFRYDFLTKTTVNLTTNYDEYLMNPIISSDDTIITLCQDKSDSFLPGTLCYFKLADNRIHQLSEAGSMTFNGVYSSLDHKIYHEQNSGLYRINLDGSNNTKLQEYPYYSEESFGLTADNNHVYTVDLDLILRIIDIGSNNTIFTQEANGKIVKNCNYSNCVLYLNHYSLYKYDVDDQVSILIPNTSSVRDFMCPTWDGNKVFYKANLRINK